MKVLAIYPAFDLSVNEMAMVWAKVCSTADVQCTVIANLRSVLKAHTSATRIERSGNLEIHRFPALRDSDEPLAIARSQPFDVIFCAVPVNMDIALRIQELIGAPIVLHVEYFLDDEVFLRRREYFGFPFLRSFFSERVRLRLHRETASILCSNPAEFSNPAVHRFNHLSYLPWPAPGDATPRQRAGRRPNCAAFVGSLSRGKGAGTLFAYFDALLTCDTDFELRIVGPTIDGTGKEGLARLLQRFPGRVHYQLHCTRREALQLLSESLFILSPGRRFGWGLIADAWGTGTPVLAPGEHYDLRNGINCHAVRTPDEFLQAARTLRDDPAAWEILSTGGLTSIREHSIDRVAERLHEVVSGLRP